MANTPGGSLGSAPVGWQPVGATTQYPGVAVASGTSSTQATSAALAASIAASTSTSSAYVTSGAIGASIGSASVSGIGVEAEESYFSADGGSVAIAVMQADAAGVGSVSGSATCLGDGAEAIQITGLASGSSATSVVGASLAAGTFIDRAEPYGYGGPVGTTALGETPLAYAFFDYTGATAYAYSAELFSGAGQAIGTSTANAVVGFIAASQGSCSNVATPGFIASAIGLAVVDGHLNFYGTSTGSCAVNGVGASLYAGQGVSAGSSFADAANGSIAATAGKAIGSCSVRAFLLWAPEETTGTLWNYTKYISGVGGALGSVSLGAIPLASTDIEPADYTQDWFDEPTTDANWQAASSPTTPNWQTPATTTTTWQKAA